MGVLSAYVAPAWGAEADHELVAQHSSPYQQLVAGIHFDSEVSNGPSSAVICGIPFSSEGNGSEAMSIAEIATKAKLHGLDVAIITDRDQAEIEYGIPGFRNLLKYRVVLPSIRTLGAERYLAQIREAQTRVPGVITIAGAECMPYYYWEERFHPSRLKSAMRSRNPDEILRLRNAHVHLMAIGLSRAEDYERLPSIATGYPVVLRSRSLLLPVYLALIGYGIWASLGRSARRRRYRNPRRQRQAAMARLGAFMLALIAVGLLVNELLHPPRRYTQHQADQDVMPIQHFINKVRDLGGMTFWAHPEAEQALSYHGISAHTPSCHEYLLGTYGYTGFAIFWEGMELIGSPRGIWDRVLMEYCLGHRAEPVWALGELDYETDWGENAIEETLTVLLVRERTEKAVLRALRTGKMYAARQFFGSKIRIEDYRITSHDGRRSAYSGDTLAIGKGAVGHLRVRVLKPVEDLSFRLIRGLDLVDASTFALPSAQPGQAYEWTFDVPVPTVRPEGVKAGRQPMSFYRVLGYGGSMAAMATNPIFVRRGSSSAHRLRTASALESESAASREGTGTGPPVSSVP